MLLNFLTFSDFDIDFKNVCTARTNNHRSLHSIDFMANTKLLCNYAL